MGRLSQAGPVYIQEIDGSCNKKINTGWRGESRNPYHLGKEE